MDIISLEQIDLIARGAANKIIQDLRDAGLSEAAITRIADKNDYAGKLADMLLDLLMA